MHTLVLDSEQVAIIEAAAEAGHAILQARLTRADPDGHLSRAATMARSKLDQIKHQMRLGPALHASELQPFARNTLKQIAGRIAAAEDDLHLDAAYTQLQSFVQMNRKPLIEKKP